MSARAAANGPWKDAGPTPSYDPSGVILFEAAAEDGGITLTRLDGAEQPSSSSSISSSDEAQPDIGPVMQAAAVTSPPEVTFWRTLETNDEVGWGA